MSMQHKSLDDCTIASMNPNTQGLFGVKFNKNQTKMMQKSLLRRYGNYAHRKMLKKNSVFRLATIKRFEEILEINVRNDSA